MGMYDRVYASCPKCGSAVEFQSKAGECDLERYDLTDAPLVVLIDVLNDPTYCRKCGSWIALVDPAFPPEAPRPKPSAVLLREPDECEISIHSSQPELRWWNGAFSYSDIADDAFRARAAIEAGGE